MVHVPSYGALPAGSKARTPRRADFVRFAAVATLALGALTAVIVAGQTARPVVLGSAAITSGYAVGEDGSTNNAETLKNIWFDTDQAWDGIDEVLPTAAGAWEDPTEPDVGYAFTGQGSVTGADGWTGYYDTTLHDGTDRAVLPDENVNAALGWDPALSGGNALWGSRGGQNVEDPAPWSNNEPLTVQEFSDSDYVPYGYTQGGPSHSSVGME